MENLDKDSLEFLAGKSETLLKAQIDSYRQKHNVSGTMISVLALFIPFFFSGLGNANIYLKFFAIIPISLLVLTITNFIKILKTKRLDQGFHPKKFDDLALENYQNVLLYEIGANRDSFNSNKHIYDNLVNDYTKAIKLTLVSVFASAFLLLLNNFIEVEKKPTEIILKNTKELNCKKQINIESLNLKLTIMSEKDEKPADKPSVIPTVPPSDRVNLNEDFKDPRTVLKNNK